MAFAGMFLVSLAFQVRQLQDGLTWFRGPESSKDVAPIYSFYAETLEPAWSMLDSRRTGPWLFCLFAAAVRAKVVFCFEQLPQFAGRYDSEILEGRVPPWQILPSTRSWWWTMMKQSVTALNWCCESLTTPGGLGVS